MINSNKKIESFLNEIKREERSSPAGMHWDDFYTYLKKFKQPDEPDPPVPLILAASGESDESKYSRLKNQLQWALDHNCFNEAIEFLRNINLENWNSGPLEKWDKTYY